MKFCLYLKNKGVITAEQLVAALELQHEKLTPIGQLAIEEGVLSARNVFKVLRCQSDLPHERFGEVAVELGLMTSDQLERLLALQASRKPSLLEILVRQGALSVARADAELVAYRRGMERRNVVITRRIVSRPHSARVEPPPEPVDDREFAMTI
jgi:hypothetical protein